MRDRNKNKKSSPSDFIRYTDDKMNGEERNAFERELQKDPFAKEASEGFASISKQEALEDISYLHKHLKKRVFKRQRSIFYRIAASIAVLMVVSSIFIIVEKNRSMKQIVSTIDKAGPTDISESQPITGQSDKRELSEQPVRISEKKRDRSIDKQNKPESVKAMIPAENNKIADYQYIDSTDEIEVKPMDKHIRSEQISAVSTALAKGKRSSQFRAEGKVLSSEDNMPISGVSIVIKGTDAEVITDAGGNFNITLPDSDSRTLVASFIGMKSKEFKAMQDTPAAIMLEPSLSSISEVVAVGYGVKKDESEKEGLTAGYVPPQPIDGKSNFDKYIHDNLQRPDTISPGQKFVVVLSFLVRTDGSIDSIRIIRSPGKSFSDEVIRLIRSGPVCKPAEENGKLIEDQVRVRVVFK